MNRSNRILLGVAAAVLALGGAGLLIWGESRQVTGEVMIRAGAVLAALWLVAPEIKRPGLAAILWMVAGVLVLIRPRLVFVLVVGVIVWLLGRRSRR